MDALLGFAVLIGCLALFTVPFYLLFVVVPRGGCTCPEVGYPPYTHRGYSPTCVIHGRNRR